MKEIDIKYLLRAWANSIVSHRMGVEYPSHSTPFLGAPREPDYRPMLTEDEVNAINGAWHNLNKQNIELSLIIKLHYLEFKSTREIARLTQEPQSKILKKISDGENFILGCLYGFLAHSTQYFSFLQQD